MYMYVSQENNKVGGQVDFLIFQPEFATDN